MNAKLLALSILLGNIRAFIIDPGACGFAMREGVLDVDCEGFYSLVYENIINLHPCAVTNNVTYHAPVEIHYGSCSTLLVNYSMATNKMRALYCLVLPFLVATLFLAASIIVVYSIFIHRVTRTKTKRTLNLRNVALEDDTGIRVFSWLMVISIGLCHSRVIAVCVPPIKTINHQTTIQYKFTLEEGEKACFNEGVVDHQENVEQLEYTFLYSTSSWSHSIWSETKCGHSGWCGTREECAVWGTNGKIINHHKQVYKKICAPHARNFFVCPHMWGCWLATLEVTWDGPIYHVYEIGTSTTTDKTDVMGLGQCDVDHLNEDPVDMKGDILVISSNSQWLCKTASERGFPLRGHIGDIQLRDNVTFDFSVFACEFTAPESSGGCSVMEPHLPRGLQNCLSLPHESPQGLVSYNKGKLTVKGNGDRNYVIRCPSSVRTDIINGDCFSLRATHHGVKGVAGIGYLVLSAKSREMKSSMLLNTSCFDEPIVVPCDGVERVVKSDRESFVDCMSIEVRDERRMISKDEWVWDSGNHQHPISQTHYISLTVVLLISALILIVRLVLK